MSMETGPVMVPNCAAWRTRYATFALQISFLLARQLIVGTGAPDIAALHDGSSSPGSRHLPSQELATLAAAEDQDFKPFWLSHALPCLCGLSVVLHQRGRRLRGWNEGARVPLAALA